jgi:hypothetical protein
MYNGGLPPSVAGGFITQNGIDIGQTFTVGLSGELTGVEVAVARSANTTQPLDVEVRSTIGGTPDASDASILASALVEPSSIDTSAPTLSDFFDFNSLNFVFVDLSSSRLQITPGETLAIVLESNDPVGGYAWAFGVGDPGPYLGGQGYFRSSTGQDPFMRGGGDQYFETIVSTVPEPSTFLLLFSAIPGIAVVIRRKKFAR